MIDMFLGVSLKDRYESLKLLCSEQVLVFIFPLIIK